MRVTIKGLRRWVAAAVVLLLAVVAGSVIYGRYRFRRIEKDLPARLGANIQQTATGWTWSQSSGGHTLFTMKASKESQLKSGHVLLHDVDITLYGPPGSGRQDRIYGSDFEYDTNTQIAVSQGGVNIELAGMGGPPGTGNSADSNTIRVRTSGLTFAQKTGQAETQQPVEFQLPRAAGTSVGANYDSKTGVLVLDSQVKITTSSNGKSALVQAAHAIMLRNSLQAFLTGASFEYATEDGNADEATVYFRKDGTTEKIDAQGHVTMKTDTGATVTSATAQILMDAKSQPTLAELKGGVTYASERGNASMHGTASEGTLRFVAERGADGRTQTALQHAEFRRDVNFAEAIAGLAKDPRGHAEKQVQGQKVDVDFAPPGAGGQIEARKVVAVGNPIVTMRQMPSKGPASLTRISGDQLVAMLDPGNVLKTLDGTGNTKVDDESTDGSRDTSQGDILHATFSQRAAPAAGSANRRTGKAPAKNARRRASVAPEPRMEATLDTAVQDGHVIVTETPAGKPGSTDQPGTPHPGQRAESGSPTLTGWASHAEYHAGNQTLQMTGNPRIRNNDPDGETMQVAANRIDYHRDTQDAEASGDVRATYTQAQKPQSGEAGRNPIGMGGSNAPVDVIAERAAIHHASNRTDFYGTVPSPARMWQEADSLAAPAIEIDRQKNVLKAWGEGTGTAPVVSANLTSAMGSRHQQSVARVRSQTLLYSDASRQADFRGNVSMEQGGDVIRAGDALVFLKPTAGTKGGAASAASGPGPTGKSGTSQIDHVVATEHVVFTQQGRKGEGNKLVYTADDGRYLLTGTPDALPWLWDSVHGRTTGTALLFNSQDDSVEVSGGKSSAVTDTRAPK
ncbi:MAG TPA: LptA/OstA family protein [Acidobacteriaceae bacterium]